MKALIVVDMLDEFVHGRLGSDKARAALPACERWLGLARQEGWPVAFACDAHFPGDPELAIWGEHAMAGTPGAQVVPELAPDETDPTRERKFEKRAYSAFSNHRLAGWLRERGVDSVVVAGVCTHICVAETAIAAAQEGLGVEIDPEAVAGFEDTDEDAWLAHLERVAGAHLVGVAAS